MSRITRSRNFTRSITGRQTKVQMVYNLLAKSPGLRPCEIISALASRGVKLADGAASTYRKQYFTQNRKSAITTNRSTATKITPPTTTNSTVAALRKLIEGVRAVGGKKNAAEIVALLS